MISIILCEVQNLGDHGREVSTALEVNPKITIQELVNLTLFNPYPELPAYNNHIEIRLSKPLEIAH